MTTEQVQTPKTPAAGDDKPEEGGNPLLMHSSVKGDPISTPGYWRVAWTIIGGRYFLEFFNYLFTERKLRDQQITPAERAQHENAVERRFDASVGVMTVGTTLYYAKGVYSDIKRVFAETVGYEKGKPVDKISFWDMWTSDNKLVSTTMRNFVKFNAQRLIADSLFFLRSIPPVNRFLTNSRNVRVMHLGVGAKALLLTRDMISKQRTYFEDTVRFIDSKINPKHALGDRVEVSDLVDLFQKYAELQNPAIAFNGNTNNPTWADSEIIFQRAAELMNRAYRRVYTQEFNPKYDGEPPPKFMLPEYQHLLGMGMINPHKVKESLANIEMFNAYGIEGLNEFRAALKQGQPIDALVQQYALHIPKKIPYSPQSALPPDKPEIEQSSQEFSHIGRARMQKDKAGLTPAFMPN